jgi:hypothetical protein
MTGRIGSDKNFRSIAGRAGLRVIAGVKNCDEKKYREKKFHIGFFYRKDFNQSRIQGFAGLCPVTNP